MNKIEFKTFTVLKPKRVPDLKDIQASDIYFK